MKHKRETHLFILVGEQSGDLHASHLIRALRQQDLSLRFSGVAGPSMLKEGVECIVPMEKFAVMGFTDVIKNFPSLYKQFYLLRDHILKFQPEGVIFVDYPGFNLRMAKALRKAGYKGKLIHYICPSVWAWGKKRIDLMAHTLDLLLTIYPFEANFFGHTSLPVKYVGNPLQEYISKHQYDKNWKNKFPWTQETMIAIFPGSRLGEIQRNLPKQLQAATLFQKNHPHVVFGVSCSNPVHQSMIEKMIADEKVNNAYTVPQEYTYELMQDSHCAIAKSGTVTLELALHQCPTVVVYALSTLNWLIAKFLIRLNLPHYCIVNILNEKRVFPELIKSGYNKENLARELENVYTSPARDECLLGCEKIVKLFQGREASHNAAQAIRDQLI